MARMAHSTENEGASISKNFIDGVSYCRDLFDDFYFDDLNRVAQEIDKIEGDMVSELEVKENYIKDLQDEIEELKQQLEDLK